MRSRASISPAERVRYQRIAEGYGRAYADDNVVPPPPEASNGRAATRRRAQAAARQAKREAGRG